MWIGLIKRMRERDLQADPPDVAGSVDAEAPTEMERFCAGFREADPSWRQARFDAGLGRKRRFPLLIQPNEGFPRPFLFVRIASGRNPRCVLVMPALVDTGAHVSLAPRPVCELLGYDFARGRPRSSSLGICGSTAAAYAHEVVLTVIDRPRNDPDANVVFGPLTLHMDFVDGMFPYLLLGQQDFLRRVRFEQVQAQGYFELEWLLG